MKAQCYGNQEAAFLEARGESVSKPAEPLGSYGDQGGCTPPARRALLPASPLLTGPDHMSTAFMYLTFSEIQFSHSVVSDSAIPWTAACQTSLSITNSWSLLKLMSIESVMPSNHLILCRPLLLLPSIFPCIRVFSNESVLRIRWPKYRNFHFSISPSNEYSGLISFRIDWFDFFFFFEIFFIFG